MTLAAAVKLLHARGARVIGRLVAFRDPVLAEWAWTHGRRDLVIQTPEGGAYSGGYGGFTNYVHPHVQRVQRRSRRCCGEARHRRRPLRLRSPAGRAARLDGRPGPRRGSRAGSHRLPRASAAAARAARHVPRRVRLRHRRHAARRDRPGRSRHRPRGRLRRADALPVPLGPEEYGVANPETRAVRDRAPVAGRLPAQRPRDGCAASCRGSRTSRSVSSTENGRCGRRSTPRRQQASTSSCSGTRRHVHGRAR